MQAKLRAIPEFDQVRCQRVAAPMRRTWHIDTGELVLIVGNAYFEFLARGQGLRLQRRPGANLTAARTRCEVPVRIRRWQRPHATFRTHLDTFAQGLPVPAQRRL